MLPVTDDEAGDATLTSRDVARLLRVSQDTVNRMTRIQLDFWKTPGGHRRYRLADVRRYAEELHIDLGE